MASNQEDLLQLIRETRNYLSHLQQLGVDAVEATSAAIVEHPLKKSTITIPKQEPSPPKPPITPIAAPPKSAEPFETLFGDMAVPGERLCASTESFADIHLEIGDCTRCPLHLKRTNVVHTEGNRQARLMFVGEAPGADEDSQARPFVGRAGQLLTKIIEAIGFKREEVLIGNVNRCRPPGNRPPTLEEASMCKPFLLREIAVVQPEVIVTLGNTAIQNLLGAKQGITKLRGKFLDYKGIQVMPTYHPAYLLRDPSKKRETWEDLKKVRDYLDSKKQ